MAGATGLDHTALAAVLKRCAGKRRPRADGSAAVRVIEAEALRIMGARRQSEEGSGSGVSANATYIRASQPISGKRMTSGKRMIASAISQRARFGRSRAGQCGRDRLGAQRVNMPIFGRRLDEAADRIVRHVDAARAAGVACERACGARSEE